jgi:hypothetical protein
LSTSLTPLVNWEEHGEAILEKEWEWQVSNPKWSMTHCKLLFTSFMRAIFYFQIWTVMNNFIWNWISLHHFLIYCWIILQQSWRSKSYCLLKCMRLLEYSKYQNALVNLIRHYVYLT